MKYHIKVQAYDKHLTTRAMLVGYYGSFTLPYDFEIAAANGDLKWAIERVTFNSKLKSVSQGFTTKKEANKVVNTIRRSIDVGQGMMIGAGKLRDRLYDDVKLVLS